MRFIRFFLKIFASILIIALLTIGLASVYIVVNKKELSDKFLSVLKDEVDLDIKYSNFDISLISHFPFTALTFKDLSVDISKKNEQTNILSAQNLSLTVNSINLIRGNFSIRNCIIEKGEVNYYPNTIDSLLNQFSSEENTASNQNISINKFILKNYHLNIYDNKNKLSIKIDVNNSLIFMNLNDEIIHSSIKAELASLYTEGFQSKYPINIQLSINKTKNRCLIENLELVINRIYVQANGEVNFEKGLISLNYNSKSFSIQNLQELLSVNYKDLNIEAKSTITGMVSFNFNTSKFDRLIINHSSKGKVYSKDNCFIINELLGKTEFTNNFKSHISNIIKANIEFDNFNAILSARVKGLNNPIVLTEGLIKLNRSKHSLFDKLATINASGNIKALLSIRQNKEQFDIWYHNISGMLNFNIETIEGVDKLSDIKGSIECKEDIIMSSTGLIGGKPFTLNINQHNFLSVLNDKTSINPEILVDAEEIDVFYITEIISSSSKNKETKPDNNRYRLKIETKNLKYMNYAFQNVSCGMLLTNNTFEIQNFIGNGFDGKLSGSLLNIGNKYFIKTDFEGMNVSKLFYHYDNFKQNLVTNNNIAGNISGSTLLNFTTNDKGKIDLPSIKMESEIIISNGKISGMNKIEKLSKWLKLEQVKSIDFKTLRNKIEISNGCIKIPQMDVLSNVINMKLSGEHYFAGDFTYWMKINFSQVLSRRFLNSSISNEDDYTSNGSINLYLKLFGDNNNYDIKLDKKSSFENIRGSVQSEGKTLKQIFKEEFKQITKKDTATITSKDSTLRNNTKFNIEWDEYDTLNVDNN